MPERLGFRSVVKLDLEQIQNAPHRDVVRLATLRILVKSKIFDQAKLTLRRAALRAPLQHALGRRMFCVVHFSALLTNYISFILLPFLFSVEVEEGCRVQALTSWWIIEPPPATLQISALKFRGTLEIWFGSN